MLSTEKRLSLQAFVLLSILENVSSSSDETAAEAFMLVSSARAIVAASFCLLSLSVRYDTHFEISIFHLRHKWSN